MVLFFSRNANSGAASPQILLSFIQSHFTKSYHKELWFDVPTRRAFINITSEVEKCIAESGVREGLLLCNAKQI